MIRLLNTHTINKIAAGEVVERPASVVKELVENSIDAKASSLTVEIKNGGIDLIRITDNGKGIPKDEVEIAFLRHATSKITSAEDLEQVLSLGFRGEALASIAAVSHVELMTKTPGELTGKRVLIQGGKLQQTEEVACPEGTTFIMRQLFYNVPARKAFLKSLTTEGAKITDTMYKLALAHPEITFKYIQNNRLIFTTPGNGDLKQCVFQLYGKDIAKNILPIYQTKGGITLSGVIGKPTLTRANRHYEHFFINGRFVKSPILGRAVEEAYKTRIMIGKFPFVVLHIELPPDQVDVNVHPTKLEVRFREQENLEMSIKEGIRASLNEEVFIPEVETLQKKASLKPEKPEIAIEQVRVESFFQTHTPPKPYQSETLQQKPPFIPATEVKQVAQEALQQAVQALSEQKHQQVETYEDKLEVKTASLLEERVQGVSQVIASEQSVTQQPYTATFGKETNRNDEGVAEKESPMPYTTSVEPEKTLVRRLVEGRDYRVVGQLLQTYWMVEIEEQIIMIDQHAAHERIIYEQYMADFTASKVATQMLLVPETLRLSPIDFEKVRYNQDFLTQLGFAIELFGEDQIVIREVPYLFNTPLPTAALQALLETITIQKDTTLYSLHEEKIIQMACKKAVKARDRLDERECHKLIQTLLNLQNPYSCPHGRPTMVTLKATDIEKIFKRIQ